ncbi:MAG: hypothetical protein ACQETH_14835 [Candidatus Rifleibacteriota bacterium]
MEEFKERVSDILKSPVMQIIWQFRYRQILCFALVLVLTGTTGLMAAGSDRITRYELIKVIYERFFNRQITEIEAINTGLLNSYADEGFHLEWPVSRGMAAQAFYRLWQQTGSSAKMPRAFADIDKSSNLKNALNVVGGAFLPQNRGNFNPNHVLTRKSLFRSIKVLIEKEIIKQQDRFNMKIDIIEQPVAGTPLKASASQQIKSYAIRPNLGFAEKDTADSHRKNLFNKFDFIQENLENEQLDPQVLASINDAVNAMSDVEQILERLGGSVLEMTAASPSSAEDEQALREGLAKIEGVLKSIADKFIHARLQLKTLNPVNPENIDRCAKLDQRMEQTISEAGILQKRIQARLAQQAKGIEE